MVKKVKCVAKMRYMFANMDFILAKDTFMGVGRMKSTLNMHADFIDEFAAFKEAYANKYSIVDLNVVIKLFHIFKCTDNRYYVTDRGEKNV